MSRLQPIRFVFPGLVAAAMFGCTNESTTTDTNSTEKAPTAEVTKIEVPKDDPAAVLALTEAGFILTKNAEGQVVELSVNCETDKSDAFIHLAGVPNAVKAGFSGPGLTDKGMENLASLINVKRLDLSDSAIGDETLKTVAKLKNVEVLGLRRTSVTDSGLAAISALPKVRAIDLRNSNITDDGLQQHVAVARGRCIGRTRRIPRQNAQNRVLP